LTKCELTRNILVGSNTAGSPESDNKKQSDIRLDKRNKEKVAVEWKISKENKLGIYELFSNRVFFAMGLVLHKLIQVIGHSANLPTQHVVTLAATMAYIRQIMVI
jgi:hypothetical protein